MVYNRVRGVKNSYYWLLALLLVIAFWSYLSFLIILFHADNSYDYGHYLIYQFTALAGLGIASLNSQKLNDKILRCDLFGSHIIALRNVLFVAGAILLLLVLFKDPQISRLFLFTYLPLLYLAFFYAHRHLPRFLMRTFFSDRHQHKALLVGPLEKAREMQDYLKKLSLKDSKALYFLVMHYSELGRTDEASISLATGERPCRAPPRPIGVLGPLVNASATSRIYEGLPAPIPRPERPISRDT